MVEDLLLLSGTDIPFFSAQINLRQPLIKDIAVMGEENFFTACQFLTFKKENLSEEDRSHLVDIDDFQVLMLMINSPDFMTQKIKVIMLFALILPNYTIIFEENQIVLKELEGEEEFYITSENFEDFRNILEDMFELKPSEEEQIDPGNRKAAEIAEKIKRGRKKVAEMQNKKNDKISILGRYASILAIGLSLDISIFLNYTVYQLFDAFKRFQLYQSFDINLKARMAGATDLEEVENWMDDIHP